MITVLQRLAEVSSLQPTTKGLPIDYLTRRAYPLALSFTGIDEQATNTMPLGRLWIPMLDRWWGWVVLFLILFPLVLMVYKLANIMGGPPLPEPFQKIYHQWMATTFDSAVDVTPKSMPVLVRIPFALLIWVLMLCWPSIPASLFWLIYGARGWIGSASSELTRRKKLAALFCLQDGTGPDGIERYLHDDEVYIQRVDEIPRTSPLALRGAALRRPGPVPLQVQKKPTCWLTKSCGP